MERVPGHHCAEENEQGGIEHEVDDDGEGGVFGGGVAAVAEAAAGAEGNEKVIDAEGRGESNAEYGGEEVEGEIGCGTDHLALVGEAVEPVEGVTEGNAENDADNTLVKDGDEEPFLNDVGSGDFGQEAETHEEKGEGYAVVAAALCAEQIADSLGDAFAKLTVGQDGGGKHGIRGGEAGRNCEGCCNVGVEEEHDEAGAEEPAYGHNGAEEDQQSAPFSDKIATWKLEADSKTLYAHDDASGFLDNVLE